MKIFRIILSHNWWAIIYFNFKMLPFSQAIRLPFDFYYSVRFESLSGCVFLDPKILRRGIIKIGGHGSDMFPRSETVIDIRGDVRFAGEAVIGHGALFRIEENANLSLGRRVVLGAGLKLFCTRSIRFFDDVVFSWECQVFDTNFHGVRDIHSGVVGPIDGDVEIGARNWFGNRVSVMKGTKTPSDFIVASNSLCNKDYLDLSPYVMVGGMPARVIRRNVEHVI